MQQKKTLALLESGSLVGEIEIKLHLLGQVLLKKKNMMSPMRVVSQAECIPGNRASG